MSKTILGLGFLTLSIISITCCRKDPYKADFKSIGGYIIGKENCNNDESLDYWLIDFSLYPNNPKVGTTLTLNGVTYTNVLKVKGLAPNLKIIGLKVLIDYKVISNSEVISSSCSVASPQVFSLKEIFIINQFEIR